MGKTNAGMEGRRNGRFCIRVAAFVAIRVALALPGSARADRLTVFAISAPSPTQWESPRSLLVSTVQNSYSYAPNGHVMVLLERGDQAWLTSMASARKGQTFATTVRERLGLSALYHDFEGKLDTAEASQKLLDRARRDARLAELQVEVAPEALSEMLDFVDRWIRFGAFRHYRGGQIASEGLGAGCADFVMAFVNRAFESRAPLTSWMRELLLPHDLLDDTNPMQIYQRTEWAKDESEGRLFLIPDPELIFNWIIERSPETRKLTLNPNALANEASHPSAARIATAVFQTPYAPESEATVQEVWQSIRLK